MPMFRITVINQTFRASNDHELATLEDARKQGFKAALAFGAEEVTNGKAFFGAEVLVEGEEMALSRFVVSIGASSLQ
jgi:hypothetical protein